MVKEDIEIISTFDLDRIDLFVHYRINAPNKETVIADGYTSVDYDSWLYYNDDLLMNDMTLNDVYDLTNDTVL